MKKKWIAIPFIILIIVITIIFLRGQYKMTEQIKLDKYLTSQKSRIEKYLKYNYNNIDTIEFLEITNTPMGAIHISGKINKNIDFTARSRGLEDDIEYVDGMPGDFHDKNLKKDLNGKTKSVSEIEEEERNSLSFNEKMDLLNKKNKERKSSLG